MITGLVLAVAVAGAATAKTYTCKFVGREVGKTIPEIVIIEHDETSGRVTVVDPFINNYVGSPLEGTLKSSNKTRELYSWQLPSLKDESGQWIQGVAFSVNILRASLQASISGNPQGNYIATRANGACSLK